MRALILFIIMCLVTGMLFLLCMAILDPLIEQLDKSVNETMSVSRESSFAHNHLRGITTLAGTLFAISILGTIIAYFLERAASKDQGGGWRG